MNLVITNPLGLLGLIALPILALIYFLQRRAKVVPISTLFLLEKTERENTGGRRFEAFTHTLPFWLTLLALIVLTWILLLPRFVAPESTRRIAIVIDSSASMSAFEMSRAEALSSVLPGLQDKAARSEFFVLTHDPADERIYQGSSLEDLLTSLESIDSAGSALDPAPALQIARSLVSAEGQVIYVTDHTGPTLPFGAQRLAVGSPLPNVGLTAASYEQKEGATVWSALVKNYSSSTETRTWHLRSVSGQSRTPDQSITLAPGAVTTLQGAFPPSGEMVTLQLSDDAFTVDNALPLLVPEPKQINLAAPSLPAKFERFSERLLKGFENLTADSSTPADLEITAYDPFLPVLPEGNAIVLIDESSTATNYLVGGIFTEPHPLIDDLNWSPLAARDSVQIEVLKDDRVLLWQGERPLLILRGITGQRQLIFNFDLSQSNALKLPATAVLLHRFVEMLRAEKEAYQVLNLETDQLLPRLPEAAEVIHTSLTGETSSQSLARTPQQPGFLDVRDAAGNRFLDASVSFADTRESDLTKAESENEVHLTAAAQELHTKTDPYWRLAAIAVLILLLAAWQRQAKAAQPEAAIAST